MCFSSSLHSTVIHCAQAEVQSLVLVRAHVGVACVLSAAWPHPGPVVADLHVYDSNTIAARLWLTLSDCTREPLFGAADVRAATQTPSATAEQMGGEVQALWWGSIRG